MPPRLSVVTPSFNQGRFIERTIRSVLDQGQDGVEYIVRDGGSSDETLDVLRRYKNALVWVSERDGGQADAVNRGIAATSGAIIGWLNSDDIYYPGAFSHVLAFFDAHPDVDLLYGEANHIDEHDRVLNRYYTEDWDYERLKDVCYLCQPAVFFRREVVHRFGGLDESLRYCMDYEYWLRIGPRIRVARVPHLLAGSRMYNENKTLGSRVAVHDEINRMLARALGSVPTVWLYNYAFAVYDAAGYERARLYRHPWLFGRVVATAFLRWRGYIPLRVFRTVGGWFRETYRHRPRAAERAT